MSGTFRQRASSFRSSRSFDKKALSVPHPPEMSQAESFEESLQGGWESDPSGIHRFRRLTREEQVDRVVEGRVRESDLSPDQRAAYNALCRWFAVSDGNGGVITLGGFAGTGKSTVISVFARAHQDLSVAYCAFTGKAANVLKQKLRDAGVPHPDYVGTIHRLIYRGAKNLRDEIIHWDRVENLNYDLIVVDEASMLSDDIYNDLRSFNIPILAVGDHGQLAPVEGRFNLMEKPDLRLEKVHRQAEGSPIISLATFIREEGELPERIQESENVRVIDPRQLREGLGKLFRPDMSETDLLSSAILCYTNSKRRMANALVRNIRWGIADDAPVRPNDVLLCLRNMLGVFNGMRARVISSMEHGEHWFWTHAVFDEDDIELKASMFRPQFNRNGTITRYEDIEELGFAQAEWSKKIGMLFDFGYALTVHKAQGSSFKDVFLLYERPNMIEQEEWRRWLYTAVTRSSERLAIVTR